MNKIVAISLFSGAGGLDLGFHKRQIVLGIAKFYKPVDFIVKKVALVYIL